MENITVLGKFGLVLGLLSIPYDSRALSCIIGNGNNRLNYAYVYSGNNKVVFSHVFADMIVGKIR